MTTTIATIALAILAVLYVGRPAEAVDANRCKRLGKTSLAALGENPQVDLGRCSFGRVIRRLNNWCSRRKKCSSLNRRECRSLVDKKLARILSKLGCENPTSNDSDTPLECPFTVEYELFPDHGPWEIGLGTPFELIQIDEFEETGNMTIDYSLSRGESYEFTVRDIPNAANFPASLFQGKYRLHMDGVLFASGNVDAAEFVTFAVAADGCRIALESQKEFQIDFLFDNSVDEWLMPVFRRAAARWSSVIRRSASVKEFELDGRRLVSQDLIVDASFESISSPGTIAIGGPTGFRDELEGWRPFYGFIRIDPSEVQLMGDVGVDAEDVLLDVISHELGHVLGLGPLWQFFRGDLIDGLQYIGPNAVRQYRSYGPGPVDSIPLADDTRPTTFLRHWKEDVLDNELMTGVIDPGRLPLSRISIGFLQDIGYDVRYDQADPFSLPDSPAEVVESLKELVDDGFKLLGNALVKPTKSTSLLPDIDVPSDPDKLDKLVGPEIIVPIKKPRS